MASKLLLDTGTLVSQLDRSQPHHRRRSTSQSIMAKTKTFLWDPAEHLETEADMAAYLEAALEDGDPALVAAVLDDIARAKGMTQLEREAGLGRESL